MIEQTTKLSPRLVRSKRERVTFTRILRQSGLPTSDIDGIAQILIGYYDDDEMVGTGGLEFYGSSAVLRSVSLLPAYRGKQLGSFIVSDLLTIIRGKGRRRVYLLTETARDFFRAMGFEETSRDAIPTEVSRSTQFLDVCPASAQAMWKDLSTTSVTQQEMGPRRPLIIDPGSG